MLLSSFIGSISGCHSGVAGGQGSDAAVDAAVDLVIKLPPPDADCPADAAGGGGQCPFNFCGTRVGAPPRPPASSAPTSSARPATPACPAVRRRRETPCSSAVSRRSCPRRSSAPTARRAPAPPTAARTTRSASPRRRAPDHRSAASICRDRRRPQDRRLHASSIRRPPAGGRPPLSSPAQLRVEDRRHGVRARGRLPGRPGLRRVRPPHGAAHLPEGRRHEVDGRCLRGGDRVSQRPVLRSRLPTAQRETESFCSG